MTERLIKIQYYTQDVKPIAETILPFQGFQWIDTEVEAGGGVKVRVASIKVTIFESLSQEVEKK